jgi:glycosyltransferase involved in cell wall biosynthesis
MTNKNLLVVSHSYANFVKNPIELMSPYFEEVNVLVRTNPITNISSLIHINYLEPYSNKSRIDMWNKPFNVNIYKTPIFYTPTNFSRKKLLDKHFNKVHKMIKQHNLKFDMVHAHFAISAGYVGAKLKEEYNVPFFVTVHGYDIYDVPFRSGYWKEKIEYVLNAADHIFTVSNSNLEIIKKLNIKTKTTVIPNGFSRDLFFPRNSTDCKKMLKLPVEKKIILSVGNLIQIKGHSYLIEAMKDIVTTRKDVLCIIIGSGELKNKLNSQIKKYNLDSYVKILNEKTHNEIPLWMNACDIFVLPSLRESFGIVQIEAMACEKPIVATRNGGSDEIISKKDYGLLVEPGNSKELADAIKKALNTDWDYEAIKNYSEQFTWEKSVMGIINAYNIT